MGLGVGTFGIGGERISGKFWGNVDPTGFKLTKCFGRTYEKELLTLNNGSCRNVAAGKRAGIRYRRVPAGTQGTQLAAGQWTVKIEGFVTDNATCGTSCPDPTPASEACFGVITSDGTCDITGGDILCGSPSSRNHRSRNQRRAQGVQRHVEPGQ